MLLSGLVRHLVNQRGSPFKRDTAQDTKIIFVDPNTSQKITICIFTPKDLDLPSIFKLGTYTRALAYTGSTEYSVDALDPIPCLVFHLKNFHKIPTLVSDSATAINNFCVLDGLRLRLVHGVASLLQDYPTLPDWFAVAYQKLRLFKIFCDAIPGFHPSHGFGRKSNAILCPCIIAIALFQQMLMPTL